MAMAQWHQLSGWVPAWEGRGSPGSQVPSLAVCLVAEAAAETSLEGGNMALAIFIPVLIISLLLGGAYIYITRYGAGLWVGVGAAIH